MIPAPIKSRMVDDYENIKHWWSVRWAAIGSVVLPSMDIIPSTCPDQIAALFPVWLRASVTGFWCIGFIVFRVWAQNRGK